MKVIRTVICLTLAAMMLSVSAAFAAEVEIVFHDVNYRKTPGGKVIHQFAGGEVLTAVEEVRRNDRLWYHLSSDRYGDGYVSAEYAKPVWEGRYVYDAGSVNYVSAAVTENMFGFLEEWTELHFDYGFCYWDEEEECRHYPEMSEAERKEKSSPECRIRLAEMLFRYGFIWETEDHAVLNDPDVSEAEKAETASEILKNHYGTDDIYRIIRSCYVNGFPQADWHCGIPPYEADAERARCEEIIHQVENEHGRNTPESETASNEELFRDGCYINPAGGTKLHADPCCPSINPKYLPLTRVEYTDGLIGEYRLCSVCCIHPAQPEEEESPETELFLNPPYTETELAEFTKEWEKTYGDYRLWDLDTLIAYETEYGTIPGDCWNNTVLSCIPDENELTEEEAVQQAYCYIPMYDGKYTAEYLQTLKIAADHRKAESDLISENGSWLIAFYDCSGPEPLLSVRIYIDGHTGIPGFCRFAPNVSYRGVPGESSAEYD